MSNLTFEKIEVLRKERKELFERCTNFEKELANGATTWRKETLRKEITKIKARQHELKQLLKGVAANEDNLYKQVVEASFPKSVCLAIQKELNRVSAAGGKFNDIIPVSMYRAEELEAGYKLRTAAAENDKYRKRSFEYKKTASMCFQLLNSRLTPDEIPRFRETMDFLRKVINDPQ